MPLFINPSNVSYMEEFVINGRFDLRIVFTANSSYAARNLSFSSKEEMEDFINSMYTITPFVKKD